LFNKTKKLSVLQIAALLLVMALATIVGACQEEELGGKAPGSQKPGNLTPIADDFTITGLSAIASGSTAHTVNITPKEGKSQGDITIYYDYSESAPSAIGSYEVTFDVAEADGWNAAAGLSAGTLVIENQSVSAVSPVVDDFTITLPTNTIYAGDNAYAVTIQPKEGKSGGQITIYYEGISPTVFSKSQTKPTEAGSYEVTFNVAEAASFNAAAGLSAGTLTIQAAQQGGENENDKNYISGPDALSWGNSAQASVLTLGLTPGSTTAEIRLNWYSSGSTAGKVAQVRFVRGTFNAGKQLITATGTVSSAGGSTYTAHKVAVSGLIPGASYQYAVSSDGTNWSAAYNFKIPATTGPFKFAVITDPQVSASSWDTQNRYTPTAGASTANGWKEAMAKIVAAGVSFIASAGDQVDNIGGNAEGEYTILFAPEGLRSLPFAPVSGNHDNHLLYNYHFNWPGQGAASLTEGRNYYYLYNNILFVVLDTAPYPVAYNSSTSPASSAAATNITQYRATIQAAKVAYPSYDWLIVQHHKSTASVADHLADRDIEAYVKAGFETLMSTEGVDFVLAGHDHVYARSYPLTGKDNGQVSAPDKSFPAASGSTWDMSNRTSHSGKPIYFTFTTASGLKYYNVAPDQYFAYPSGTNNPYVKNNTTYPYLGDITGTFQSTQVGSTAYMTKNYKPVSNAAFVQPYIPSYTIVEVNGRTITFSTYPIGTKSGQNGSAQPYSFNENTPYDVITVTK